MLLKKLHKYFINKHFFVYSKGTSGQYSKWIRRHESYLFDLYKKTPEIMAQLELKPLLSVLMPVYNTDKVLLNKAINSVYKQLYTNWELCVCNDASTAEHVKPLLDHWSEKDERIKVVHRSKNGNISLASNSTLELVSGDYTVLMDHDDELRPHSLLEVVKALNNNPEALFIYSDEDKINLRGKRYDPFFKPDWDPDRFYVQNYLNHLTVLGTKRLKAIGGWRKGYEGSQDHDLFLRFLHGVPAKQIVHIPKILYHWRVNSSSFSETNKNAAVTKARKAIDEHLKSNLNENIKLSCIEKMPYHRIHFPLPGDLPMVSLIIPIKDKVELTSNCINSIFSKTFYESYEIIIVDNLSEEKKTHDFLKQLEKEHSNVRVLQYSKPFNYSAIMNFAVNHANGEIIGTINNDIEIITSGWLKEMVSHAVRPEIGCVGAKLYYPDNTIQHGGVILGVGGVAGHAFKNFSKTHNGYFGSLFTTQTVSAVTGAFLLTRKEIFNLVGGFNEKQLAIAFNDVDFCLKVMRSGYRNLFNPHVEAFHLESVSRGLEDTAAKRKRFKEEISYMQQTWNKHLKNDPYYSINLTRNSENFAYRT